MRHVYQKHKKKGLVILILFIVILVLGFIAFLYKMNVIPNHWLPTFMQSDAAISTEETDFVKYEEESEQTSSEVLEPLPQGEELKSFMASKVTEAGMETAVLTESVKVRGIYVTGMVAGHERMNDIVKLLDETELNAVVIDVKNDDGMVTYSMDNQTVQEIGAVTSYIKDIDGLLQMLHERDIYVIARVVTFRDPYLAKAKPEWSIHKTNGSIFLDRNGLAWVNPYNKEVWDYIAGIASKAAEDGFDEIQFDYIRFSTDIKDSEVNYGEDAANISKQEIITAFTQYIYETLSPLHVTVSADVFGTIIDNKVDAEHVGQDFSNMGANLDVICPMIYPSHYANNVYHLDIPDAHPYETILAAMNASTTNLSSLEEGKRPIVRPWLQDFTATWVKGHITYDADAVRKEIQAVYDAGYEEWILWNASNYYTQEALLTKEETNEQTENAKQ